MKSLLFSALILFGSIAFANGSLYSCRAYDAQFIGNVMSPRMDRSGEYAVCYYQVQLYMFNPNYICPLDIAEASNYEFVDSTCSKKDGERISGLMYKMDGVISIE